MWFSGRDLNGAAHVGHVVSPGRYRYHQQYLYKNPDGYRCHSNTGIPFPAQA